jgi:imidazolonepropionase-like amidohydrolase
LGVAVLKEYSTPTRKQRRQLSVAAQQAGLGIVSHLDNLADMLTGIVDGFTGGDHAYVPLPLYKDVLEMLRQSGYIWTPNVVTTGGTLGTSADARNYFLQSLLAVRPQEIDKLRSVASPAWATRLDNLKPSVPYATHRSARVAHQAALAAEYGVHLGVSGHNMPGILLHAEMWHLRTGGLGEEDIIRAVTIGNAEKLGLDEEIGSLEPGKRADLLVLYGNPLDEITESLSIRYVVMRGVAFALTESGPQTFEEHVWTNQQLQH